MSIEERLERLERILILSSKEALNASECALMLGITEGRVRHLACEKAIPYYKQGKSLYFRKSEIEDWMLKHRVLTKEETEAEAATYCALNKKK